MNHETLIPIQPEIANSAHIDSDTYKAMYARSVSDPEGFWGDVAAEFEWIKQWDRVKNTSFTGDVSIRWFEGARLNITANCIDRHAAKTPNKTAILWEGDEPGQHKAISYKQLKDEVCRLANALKSLGVKKGDRVTIYMPMVPQAAYAMLACARIGAVHSVVFGGFSADAIRSRIEDCNSDFIITADSGCRGGKTIPLKATIDAAIEGLTIRHVLVLDAQFRHPELVSGSLGNSYAPNVDRSRNKFGMTALNDKDPPRDILWSAIVPQQSTDCTPEVMAAEDPLFILYTSGSTGKPKGLLHTTAGYMVYAAYTHKLTFDLQPNDVYWCTADVGWITGHSYLVYGPLANGATTLMFEGVPSYPDASRFWQVIDEHKVTKFYTAPTAIRALMKLGDAPVKKTSRASLKILGTVGEPINPEAWLWYYHVVGEARCPIVDTWWQTETGGHMMTPLPGAMDLKPGSCSLPFFGVQSELYDSKVLTKDLCSASGSLPPQGEGQGGGLVGTMCNNSPPPNLPPTGEGAIDAYKITGAGEGMLVIADSWPGQARTVYGDHKRFIETYFSQVPGKYFTSDGARRDADGYYWITGRVDDVIKVSGHRLGTAEIESALVGHGDVAEAAVVGYPHAIKGEGIYAYVILKDGADSSLARTDELKQWVRKTMGPVAQPDFIHFTPGLPKTRSGKIMRRILRKIAAGDTENLGDTTTLLDPEIVTHLIATRQNPATNAA